MHQCEADFVEQIENVVAVVDDDRLHALRHQLAGDAWTHPPNFANLGTCQQFVQLRLPQRAQMTHLGVLLGVTARLALSGLGDVIGQLGQGLGRADANTARNADPAPQTLAHGV